MNFLKELLSYAIILIVVIVIRTFIITPVIVSGDSMYDTLKNGNILILKKYDRSYERGDVVVFNYRDSKLVKRVIGLPGEVVTYVDGVLYINGVMVEDEFASDTNDFKMEDIGFDFIPDGQYLVLGDNRMNSSDSRSIGLVSSENIIGVTSLKIWPPGLIK